MKSMAIKFEANQLLRDEHFLVTKKETKLTSKGDNYYQLELSRPEGKIEAKIWNNNLAQCQVEVGKIIEVSGKTQEYKGQISLIIDRCQVVESEEAGDFSAKVPTMVFDIETVGKKFEELDEVQQNYLLNNLERAEENKEIAKKKTGLYSIFGMVCAIGAYNPNSKKGMVLLIGDKDLIPEKENYTYKIFENEKDLLTEFWKIAKEHELFVTYNGEGFDFPYLVIRSGINRVKVPFEIKKWGSDKFIDLQNKIRQNNRAFQLEMLCKVFGIENPKEKGVHGGDVNELFDNKNYQKIADYVARDAYSTSQLYLIWKEFMSGEI
jgi:DNA polymerase elongation subunit (family B)